jgi:hypothetical protein
MRQRPSPTGDERAAIRRWMRRIFAVWIVVVAATLSLSLPGPVRSAPARAEARTLNGECAREDVKAAAWIDDQVQRRVIPPALLAEAALRVLQARNTCQHGRVAAALQAYEAALRFADPARAAPGRQADVGK